MIRAISKLLLIAAIPLLASCSDPDEGRKLAEGKELGAQAAVSLEQFKSAHGQYPESLAALHPDFLKTPLREIGPGNTQGVTFSYKLNPDGTYKLSFHYFGPGANECTLQPGSQPQQWKCRGFY